MRIIATHNDKEVVIVAFLYEDGTNLKAIYHNEDGEIDDDDVANFVIDDTKARITET